MTYAKLLYQKSPRASTGMIPFQSTGEAPFRGRGPKAPQARDLKACSSESGWYWAIHFQYDGALLESRDAINARLWRPKEE